MRLILLILLTTGILMSKNNSNVPDYFTKTLKNGLHVVAVPMNNDTGVVSCDIFYKVGSRNEVMGKSGIAHMLEHLNFKSTKNLAAGEFDVEVKKYGGVNNASTSFDQTHYYIRSSAPKLDRSLELFAELMGNLSLQDEEFQPERDVVAEERRWRTDNNPIGYLYFRLFNTAFTYHSYHWTPIGFMNDIQTWDIQDIKDFHSMYYQPQNAFVVVSGDIKKEDVFALSEKHFGSIKNNEKPLENIVDAKMSSHERPHFVEPQQDGARRLELEKESEVEMVAIAYKIPNYAHEDQVALSALTEVLSAGKSSRLYKTIVDQKRMANQIYGYNMETLDPGLFIFLAVCNPDIDATLVEKEILDIIKNLQDSPVTKEELAKVKLNVHSDFVFGFESASSVSDFVGSYFVKNDVDSIQTIETKMQNVTAKEIQAVAQKYFIPTTSTTILLKKPKEQK